MRSIDLPSFLYFCGTFLCVFFFANWCWLFFSFLWCLVSFCCAYGDQMQFKKVDTNWNSECFIFRLSSQNYQLIFTFENRVRWHFSLFFFNLNIKYYYFSLANTLAYSLSLAPKVNDLQYSTFSKHFPSFMRDLVGICSYVCIVSIGVQHRGLETCR